MIIGVKGLTWAPIASGGEGSAVVYSGGESLTDMMVHVDYSVERDESGFYADDHQIDGENSVRAVNVSLELAKLPIAARKTILGWAEDSTNNEYSETDQPAPYVGVGFVYGDRYKGTITYIPIWIYKVQFGLDNENADTKGESISFQTRTISGKGMAVQLDSSGVGVFRTIGHAASAEGFATYAAALAWLKTKAGISGGG